MIYDGLYNEFSIENCVYKNSNDSAATGRYSVNNKLHKRSNITLKLNSRMMVYDMWKPSKRYLVPSYNDS